MKKSYPHYQFTIEDVESQLVQFVPLNNPDNYPFDEFHSHGYNEILFFIQGGGRHNINFNEYTIIEKSVHLLVAGDIHWVKRGMQSKGFAIVYKETFLLRLKELNPHLKFFDFYNQSQVINLTDNEFEEYRFIIDELLSRREDKAYHLSLIGAFMTKIADDYYDTTKSSCYSSDHSLLIKLIAFINKHYAEHLSAQSYAEKMGCSTSALERKLKKATGKTIAALQQEKLLNEAKRLLCKPDSCAKETAYNLGFNNESYFNNWFKKLTGASPLKFKAGIIPHLWFFFSLLQILSAKKS